MPKRARRSLAEGNTTSGAENEKDQQDRKRAARNTVTTSIGTADSASSKVAAQASGNENNVMDRVTPHMGRLLRLIEEGTTESARMAAGQLTHLTSQSSPLVLWQVLGRLQAMLQSMDSWKARQNAAMAMEGVAGNLPLSDQQAFFLVQSPHNNYDSHNNNTCHASPPHGASSTTQLQLADISIQSVLKHGQELYVAAESVYIEDKMEEEEAELDQLDQHHQDFVEERIRRQRQILSERLGLSTINRALQAQKGKHSHNDDLKEIVSNDDLTASYREAKRKRKIRFDDCENEAKESGIQNILVREMNKACEKSGAASHREPQHLLANELIYRMFDSVWQRRHGALLGILALLRAWRKTLWTVASQDGSLFGPWPEDILARSLCLIALDRFGDFSGAKADVLLASDQSKQHGIGQDSTTTTKNAPPNGRPESAGVVAPVRELAAQLFSVLWKMAPMGHQQKALSLLTQLLNATEDVWEIQHGVLLSLKYIAVVVSRGMGQERESNQANEEWSKECINICGSIAGRFLGSSNHDVSGVAARILCECPGSVLLNHSIALSLWNVVRSIDVMASNVIDMVALLSSALEQRPKEIILCLSNVASVPPQDVLKQLIGVLLKLLECPFWSIRAAVLQSLTVPMVVQSMFDCQTGSFYAECIVLLFDYYVRIIDEMTLMSEDDTVEANRILLELDKTWKSYATFSHVLVERKYQESLVLDVLERYYNAVDTMSRPTQYHFLMGSLSVAASTLIREVCRLVDIQDTLLTSFKIYLESPWIHHFELACSLLSRMRIEDGLEVTMKALSPIVVRFLEHMPICLQMIECGLWAEIERDDSKINHRQLVRKLLRQSSKEYDSNGLGSFSPRALKTLLRKQGLDPDAATYIPSDVESMRVRATVACATLAFGPIPQITPLVRALMTSIRSETHEFRLSEVANALSSILLGIRRDRSYDPSKNKILKSLASRAEVQQESQGRLCAVKVIGTYLSGLPVEAVELAASRMEFHATLTNSLEASEEDVGKALRIVQGLCRNLDSSACQIFFVDHYTKTLCRLACCSENLSVRDAARSCLFTLCAIQRGRGLDTAFPFAVEIIENEKGRSDVQRGCTLLRDLCELSPVFVGKYVRMLLPVALKTMTCSDRAVARTANEIFAVLVRLAPLAKDVCTSDHLKQTDDHSSSVIDHLIHGKPLPRVTLPDRIDNALRAAGVKLREYQLEGISWISFLMSVNLNGALCDSMGLGKTLQALCGIALAHEKLCYSNPISIVVCPATILSHWVNEVRRFFPGDDIIRPCAVIGDARERRRFWESFSDSKSNLVVVSYGTLRTDIDFIQGMKWVFCVLDEGHVLRNPQTITARASRRVPSKHRMVLSGTMIQNKVLDVWATFDFLMPNFLGSSREFTAEFVHPITRSQLPGATATCISKGMEKLKLLHQQVLPFILRREKEMVLRELPAKNITDLVFPLSQFQRHLYDAFASSAEAKESIALLESNKVTGSEQLGAKVLRVLLFLRLICSHPCLIDMRHRDVAEQHSRNRYHLSSSGKFLALFHLLRDCGVYIDDLSAGDNDDSLIYCSNGEYESTFSIDDPEEALRSNEAPLNNNTVITRQSEKTKCLVFAQFSQTLDAIEEYLFKPHMPSLRFMRLDGSVPPEHRVSVADRFNMDESVSVLLLTTRVGSLGLNLTGASMVVFVEHDFNPFVDEQAMDRVHRIGQRAESVNVYRLVAADSVDEKIMDMQKKKVAMSRAVVNTENSTLYSMGTDRLLDIFTPKAHSDNDGLPQDLDSILSGYAEDYQSLSVTEFIEKFGLEIC